MKKIKLLFLIFLLIGCNLENPEKDYDIEYVNVEKIEAYKKFDPVTQSNRIIYVATVHIDGEEQRVTVQSDKVRVIRVYKKLPSQTP